jgi:hypothetical protein
LKELKREIHAPDSVADMQRAGDGLIMATLHDLEDVAFEMLGSTKPITPQQPEDPLQAFVIPAPVAVTDTT